MFTQLFKDLADNKLCNSAVEKHKLPPTDNTQETAQCIIVANLNAFVEKGLVTQFLDRSCTYGCPIIVLGFWGKRLSLSGKITSKLH